MGVERHILSRGQIFFQKVLLERWQLIIERRFHFSHILPTWFLVFITTKYPMVETHLCLIS